MSGIFVTGAGGFIGRAFLNAFGEAPLFALFRGSDFSIDGDIVAADLGNAQHVERIGAYLAEQKIDTIVHLAAATPFRQRQGDDLVESDLAMARAIVAISQRINARKIVYASGWNVYDPEVNAPYREDSACAPNTDYGLAKLTAEQHLHEHSVTYQTVVLRIASVYGPGQYSAGLIPNFTRDAVAEGSINPSGGRTKRDYLYIDDLMAAFDKALAYNSPGFQVFNIGSGLSRSVNEAAKDIAAVVEHDFNKRVRVEPIDGSVLGTPPDNLLDIEKARSLLGFEPKTDFRSGLSRFARWKFQPIVILDLDGTVLDVTERWYRVHTDLAEEYGYEPLPREQYIGAKRQRCPEEEIMSGTTIVPERLSEYVAQRTDLLESADYLALDSPREGMLEMVEELSREFPVFLVTKRRNNALCMSQLVKLGIAHHLSDVIITGNRTKLESIKELRIANTDRRFAVIGDSEDDIRLAHAIGAPAVVLTGGVRSERFLRDHAPDFLVSSAAEARAAVEAIAGRDGR